MLDYISSKSKNFFVSYSDKIEQKKNENSFSAFFPFSDDVISYNNIWDKINITTVNRNSVSPSNGDGHLLESVSVYGSIDLIGEGPLKGLCDKEGQTFELSNDPSKNEDVFKGIYFNDIPVKNTFGNTLNFNRVFSDIRLGTNNQSLLTEFENPSLSLTNSYQTFEYNTALFGVAPNFFNQITTNGGANGITFEIGSNDSIGVIQVSTNNERHAASFKGNYVIPVTKNGESLQSLKSIEKNQPVKFSHLISNDNSIFCNIDIGSLMFFSDERGKQYSSSVNFVIKVGYDGDETILEEGGSVVYIYCSIEGIATSEYVRTFTIPLPPSIEGIDRKISIFRLDREYTVDENQENKSFVVKTISEVITEKMSYPHSSIVANLFDARSFSRIPKRTYDFKLKKIKIPSNYDPETRIYTGNWDGSFKRKLYWSDNPAWILYDMLTNKRYGLSKYGFKKSYINKWYLYSIAKYCDEYIPTGESSFIQPLRFTVKAKGTELSFDDSSLGLGEDAYFNRFPEGATVCLYNLNTSSDGSGTDLENGYKRIIYNPRFENNTFKFTILQEPPSEYLFEQNETLKQSYINDNKGKSAKNWIIDKWINSDNSSESYISDYISGLSMIETALSGDAIVESFSNNEILEPRFSCNVYFDQFQQALELLNNITTIFFGNIFWANNYIYTSNDKKRDAILLFNNSNVKNGAFSYSGSAKTARNTAVLVRYNDKTDNFKAKTVYVEDPDGMREYGFLLKEVIGIGITSKSQAKRLAKWNLITSQTESDLVQFITGSEASVLLPNDTIKIQDKLKTVKRYGGRITDLNYAAKQITLDKEISENIVGQTITVILPREIKTVRNLDLEAKQRLKLSSEALSQDEIDKQRQSQILELTISAVTNNNLITILETTNEEFNNLKKGFLWSIQNTNSSYNIVEREFRVINVIEQSPNEYQVTAMLYNESKFNNIDYNDSLTKNQDSTSQVVSISSLPSALSGDAESYDISSAVSSYYDAYFANETSNSDMQLFVNFGNLATENALNSENTGGYIVEVYKDGQKVRFALDGYDNTSFTVFLGDRNKYNSVSYDIYVYDTDYKLEDLGL